MSKPIPAWRRQLHVFRRRVEWHVMRVADPLACAFAAPRRPAGGVAIVKLDAIGDFVIWLDAAKQLRALYPGRRITLIGNAIWADFARELPYWDEVIAVALPRLLRLSTYRARLLRSVRRRGFELVLQPTYSRVFLVGDALVRATGAADSIGSSGDTHVISVAEKAISDRWYTRLLPADPQQLTEPRRHAEFVSLLGGKPVPARYAVLPALAPLPQRLRVAQPYLVVFPGASAGLRQWPAHNFAAAASQICAQYGLVAVVCGSAGEAPLCAQVASAITVPCFQFAGQTTLAEFAELVRAAKVLLGNETSAVHIAAAVGTPSVCLLGGGHYGRFVPYDAALADGRPVPEPVIHRMPCFGCDWHCSQPHVEGEAVPCISRIPVADVVLAMAAASERDFKSAVIRGTA